MKKLLRNNARIYIFARHILNIIRYSGESSKLVYTCRDYIKGGNIKGNAIRTILKILVTPYCILKYFHIRNVPGREGLALVLIAKNEAPYIEEWINYHHKNGVSHFIIFDNDSTDNFHEVLKPYIESGLVSYHEIHGRARQFDAYTKAIVNYGDKFKYMGFIDADEFLLLRKSAGDINLYEFIDNFMKEHPKAGGIIVNWCIFGSSGYETKPEGGLLENFIMRAKDDCEIHRSFKTICDPVKAICFRHVHYPLYRIGYQELYENGNLSNPVYPEIHFDKIRLNHYITKSHQEYIRRVQKGPTPDGFGPKQNRFDLLDRNEIKDTEILLRV